MRRLWRRLPEFGLYLFVFLLPWQTRLILKQGYLNGGEWEYGTYSLYGTEILLLALILLVLFRRAKEKTKLLGFDLAIGAFFVAAALSFLWAVNRELSLSALIKLVEGIGLIWFVGRTAFSWRGLANAWVASAVIQAGLSLWQFLNQTALANKWLGLASHDPSVLGTFVIEADGSRFLRAYGSLPHPNMLAAWLALAILLLFGLYFDLYRRIYQWFIRLQPEHQKFFWKKAGRQLTGFSFEIVWYLTALICLTLGLLLTFSRSAWLGLAVALAVLTIMIVAKSDQKKFLVLAKLGVVMTLVVGVTFVIFPKPFFSRFQPENRLEKISVESRLNHQEQAFKLFKEYWVVGAGLGNYTQALHDKITPNLKTWEYQPVHNLFLLVPAELSVFGLVIFLFVLVEVGWAVLQYLRRQRVLDRWKGIFVAAVVFVATTAVVDHFWWTLAFGVWTWWLVFGLWRKAIQSK